MAVEKCIFGQSPDGQEIYLYTISNRQGMKAAVTNLGAALVSLWVPDKDGNVADVVLGFDKAEDYYGNPSFFGTIIGPSANRTGGAEITIDGVSYQLDANDNANNLHSHKEKGYHKRLWDVTIEGNGVTFTLEDTDGNMGFPGNKKVTATYSLSDCNELKLQYHGCSDCKTILNPTNHTYFNLDGHDSGSIENHRMWMNASHYTPLGEGSIPTGEIAAVQGTPMDFTRVKKIGTEIDADFEQLKLAGGYDHNWVINNWTAGVRTCAKVMAPRSGRVMKVHTTLPGLQFYAGNYIDRQMGKKGAIYDKRCGFALETQFFPDAVHHDNFPSCIFGGEAGEYDSVTIFEFGNVPI